jgi:hypothetical protein
MKLKIAFLFIICMTAKPAFSQHNDGKYTFKNSQGMICDINFSDYGWKAAIKLNMGTVAPGKIIQGNGEWMDQGGGQWYQINTGSCSFDFDNPTGKLIITIYDCEKSGLKGAKYTLSKI